MSNKQVVVIEQISDYIADTMENLEAVRGARMAQLVHFLSTALSIEVCLTELAAESPNEFHKDMAIIARSGLDILVTSMVRAMKVTPDETTEAAATIRQMQEATKRQMKRGGM
jgi:hypothetical protein